MTPWKVMARYRDDGKIRIKRMVKVAYRVHETRWFRGERQTRASSRMRSDLDIPFRP